MSWIKTIPFSEATGRLRKLYQRVKGPNDNIDNIMMVHSMRPHTMEGHMAIYKYVLHHNGNTLDKWILETIGVWVSFLNKCPYCVDHHSAGLKRLLNNDTQAEKIRSRLLEGDLAQTVLSPKIQAALIYARKLTLSPQNMTEADLTPLHRAGFSEGEILEINQVTAYFNYANRTVLGLGVTTDGDILGLSPGNSEDPDDWNHK